MAHEAVTVLGTLERGRVRCSLADIGGDCWIFGLEAGPEGPPSDVTAVIEQLEGMARACGYTKIFADTSNPKLARISKRYGYRAASVVLEKQL